MQVRVNGWEEVSPVSVDKVGTYFRYAAPDKNSSSSTVSSDFECFKRICQLGVMMSARLRSKSICCMRLSSFQLSWTGRAWRCWVPDCATKPQAEQSALHLCLAARASSDRTNVLVTVHALVETEL